MVRIGCLLLALALTACAGRSDGIADVRGHLPDLHFHLTDDRGQAVTEAAFRGQTTLVYFGYSGCGAECPVTLARLAAVTARVAGPAPRVLFVTVTPDIDRPVVLHAYLDRFAPAHMTGLTGKTENLARDLRAAWPQPGGTSHGDLVYVFDGHGRARLLITPQDSDSAAVHALDEVNRG
jgi:protein SCO1/2